MNDDRIQDLARRLEAAYAGAVFDVLREMGRPNQALPAGILPLGKDMALAGPIFTVEGRPVPDLDPHQSLLHWTAMLSKAPKGHVVVCQPNDSSRAHLGELSAETLHHRGVRGYVVDGGCRDTGFIEKLGFKVFFRYTAPSDIVGHWRAESFGQPVTIGEVKVEAGDFLFGDRDGVVIIPRAMVEEVVERVETVMKTESKVRRAIIQDNMDPQEAYLKYGKF